MSSVAAASSANPANAAASEAKYLAPKDICALPDLSLLGETAGKPGEGYAENETGDFPTPGCAFDLVGDSVNTFKLFVNVDKASGRFALMVEGMELAESAGFVTEDVDGLGSKALYAVQQSAEFGRLAFAPLDGTAEAVVLPTETLTNVFRVPVSGTTLTLEYNGAEVEIASDATAATVQARLQGLAGIETARVTVENGGALWRIELVETTAAAALRFAVDVADRP